MLVFICANTGLRRQEVSFDKRVSTFTKYKQDNMILDHNSFKRLHGDLVASMPIVSKNYLKFGTQYADLLVLTL